MSKLSVIKYFSPHIIIGIITAAVFIAATEAIIYLLNENQLERNRSAIVDKAAAVRAKIEGEFNSMLFLSTGLMAHVATQPDIGERDFNLMMRAVLRSYKK